MINDYLTLEFFWIDLNKLILSEEKSIYVYIKPFGRKEYACMYVCV